MNRYLLLLVLPLFFSCSKDKTKLSLNSVLSTDCFIDAIAEDHISNSCYFFGYDSTEHCEPIILENFHPLSEENRGWLKYFCLPDSEKIFFHDESNNETFLEISFKRMNLNRTVIEGALCQDDRRNLYCIKTEFADLEFESSLLGINLRLALREVFNRFEDPPFETQPHIQINTSNYDPGGQYIGGRLHLSFLPKQEKNLFQEFFPEIQILDRTFNKVYAPTSDGTDPFTLSPDAIQFFYNKEFGIVSFIDNDGTQWVLND